MPAGLMRIADGYRTSMELLMIAFIILVLVVALALIFTRRRRSGGVIAAPSRPSPRRYDQP